MNLLNVVRVNLKEFFEFESIPQPLNTLNNEVKKFIKKQPEELNHECTVKDCTLLKAI